MKKCVYIVGASIILFGLCGCGKNVTPEAEEKHRRVSADMRNVEERDYATILIISDKSAGEKYGFTLGIARERRVGEKSANESVCSWECGDLTELADIYSEEKGKDLSLAHLKVIFLAPEKGIYMEDAKLLEMLEQDVEIAKTVPVLVLNSEEDFLDYLEDGEESAGNYIENLIRVKNYEGEKVSTVAACLKAWREGYSIVPDSLFKSKEGFRVK